MVSSSGKDTGVTWEEETVLSLICREAFIAFNSLYRANKPDMDYRGRREFLLRYCGGEDFAKFVTGSYARALAYCELVLIKGVIEILSSVL